MELKDVCTVLWAILRRNGSKKEKLRMGWVVRRRERSAQGESFDHVEGYWGICHWRLGLRTKGVTLWIVLNMNALEVFEVTFDNWEKRNKMFDFLIEVFLTAQKLRRCTLSETFHFWDVAVFLPGLIDMKVIRFNPLTSTLNKLYSLPEPDWNWSKIGLNMV